MRRNVTLGFSEEEYLRVQGAAAVARMPVATYLKWLLQSGNGGNANRDMSLVLARLDELCVAIARRPALPDLPANKTPAVLPRELLTARLHERGIPSTTIRQLTAVLDEVEARP